MKLLRVYVDTSVFGGCFDKEFDRVSRKFFAEVAQGRFRLVVSSLTADELKGAPQTVRAILDTVPTEQMEYHEITDDMAALRDAYIKARVLGAASDSDALHVAAATVLDVDMVVSWNFKHIVHFEKIAGFNAINALRNYKPIRIFSPWEVVRP